MTPQNDYIIVRREESTKTVSGIEVPTHNPQDQVVKAVLVHGKAGNIKPGKLLMVERRHALNIEGEKQLYALKPEHIVATLDE